jgi:uncharacterized protein YnzC (UPF0291/DUF896 family)
VNLDNQAEIDEFTRIWIASCRPQVEEDLRRLRELGVVDEQGNRVSPDVPEDMEDPQTDFGG